MHSTETKPHASRTEPGIRYALRVVFCVRRPVSPPPIVIVPCEGVQIGREIMHGLRLEDTRVSRNHASVRRDARGGLVVQDDKSKNGTYVNGTQVEEQELFPGDVISVGDTCL